MEISECIKTTLKPEKGPYKKWHSGFPLSLELAARKKHMAQEAEEKPLKSFQLP